jgi:hypothetical protein
MPGAGAGGHEKAILSLGAAAVACIFTNDFNG